MRGFFAAAAAIGAFAALTGANAQPSSIGLALQQDNTAITRVDYYYPGPYGYGERRYHGASPFDIPGAVIGGVAGLLDGVFSTVFDGGPYYSRPFYVSPYYGSPYYRSPYYEGSYHHRYYYSPYYGGVYYRVPDYRHHEYFDGWRRDRDWRRSERRRYYGEPWHYNREDDGYRGYYHDSYYASRYDDDPYYGYPYNDRRPNSGAYDDDD